MVTFRLIGESGGSALAVTARLGIEPTCSAEAGEPVGRGRSGHVHEQSYWSLQSGPSPEAVGLAESLQRVLDQVEPFAPLLWELAGQGYWANWFCYVGSHTTEHAVELDRAVLGRLLTLPGELWLDVHDDDDEDIEVSGPLWPRRTR
ncbi:DUF4279 domain-containing protein [Kineococcus sp. SYSU DK003]|uniref:DUF4279 domain-containing protein n=1 Tax=Kineococcus sp. SYSU DK003 TaxID=3383124 RepID=UPI003D7C7454